MSGGMSVFLSVVAAIWPLYFSNILHVRTALWISAGVCFFLANFHVWLRERKALEAEIAKHEGSRVEGEIRLGYIDGRNYIPRATNYWEEFTVGCLVTLYVDATNKNTIEAHLRSCKTSLKLTLLGNTYIGEWKHIIEGLTFDDDRVNIKSQACDFHDGMYVGRGMVQGVPKLGYLQFFIADFPTDVLFGKDSLVASVAITLTDTLDKPHVIPGVSIPLLVGKMARLGDVLEKAKRIQVSALLDIAESIRKENG